MPCVMLTCCIGCDLKATKETGPSTRMSVSNIETIGANRVDFTSEVLPILKRSCFPCHGPEMSPVSMAGFRVDQWDQAVTQGKIVPGNPSKSSMIQRITTEDQSKRMPPINSKNPPLNAIEVDLIKAWVRDGAHFDP